jgi:hypothetical protein
MVCLQHVEVVLRSDVIAAIVNRFEFGGEALHALVYESKNCDEIVVVTVNRL